MDNLNREARIKKFERVIASIQDPRDRAVMLVLWPTGLVLSEAKSIKDMDFPEKSDKGKGNVQRSKVKRGCEGLHTWL